MPYGTANHRLRKMVMFHLIRQLNQDYCFQCGAQITSVDDLSIEHKRNWKNIDAELFWDMNNIAFSHRACNVPENRRGGARRIGEPGTSWCVMCKAFHDNARFRKNANRWNGLDSSCSFIRNEKRRLNRQAKNVEAPVGFEPTTFAFEERISDSTELRSHI